MTRTTASRLLALAGLLLLATAPITLLLGAPVLLFGKLLLAASALAGAFFLAGTGGARRFFTGRAAHFGFFTTISALLVVAILTAANYVASARPKSWDLTRNRIFTLSDDTTRTLGGLDREVHAIAFLRQDEEGYPVAQDLLHRYARSSRRFTFELVDPYRAPELVKRYQIVEGGPRIVLVAGKKVARVKEPTEEALTNGLVELTRSGTRKVYFTTGHGEPPLAESDQGYGIAAQGLRDDGFDVATVSLLQTGAVPADASAVLVAGARRPLLETEVKALGAYLARGGKVGVYLEPQANAGLDALLREYGIEADDDVVVDPSPTAQLFGGSPVSPVATPVPRHPITERTANTAVVLPTARSLVALQRAEALPAPLLLSSEAAWGETRIDSLYTTGAKQDPGEKRGPLPLAMAVSRATAAGPDGRAGEARLVVVGDSEFFDDRYQQVLGNLDFFLNGVAWLGEQADRITIRPKGREGSRLFLSEAQITTIRFVTLDALPLALLALGLGLWLARRTR